MPLAVVKVSIRYESQAEAGAIQYDAVAPETHAHAHAHAHAPVASSALAGVEARCSPTRVPLARGDHGLCPYGRSRVEIVVELPDGGPGVHSWSYEIDEQVH